MELLLVDNDPISARTIRALVEGTGECSVTIVDGTTSEAVEESWRKPYGVVLIDLFLESEGLDGIDLAVAIKEHHPGSRTVVCTSSDSPIDARRAWETDIDGYLPKSALLNDPNLVPALYTLLVNGFSVYGVDPRASSRPALTERELEVLRLKAAGMSHREIGNELFVSVRTVDSHLANIKSKFGVKRSGDVVPLARRYGLA